jgi:hypothetical protein
MGDYFDGTRKTAHGFSARDRGATWTEKLPVLSRERRENAAGDFGLRAEWRRSQHSGGAFACANRFPAVGIESELYREGY